MSFGEDKSQPIFRTLTQPICIFFKKSGKETRFFLKKPGFSLTQTADLPKLGSGEQSGKLQIKLSRGAENRLSRSKFQTSEVSEGDIGSKIA